MEYIGLIDYAIKIILVIRQNIISIHPKLLDWINYIYSSWAINNDNDMHENI